MNQKQLSTPPPKNQQETKDLRSILQKQFEDVFTRHPSLTLDQAFYLEASKMHQEVLQKLNQVRSIKLEIEILSRQLGIQGAQNKRIHNSQAAQLSDSKDEEKKKRMRRTAVEIARHYTCTIDKCNKSYGSEGSLNQHIKLKHKYYYTKHLLLMDLNKNCQPNNQS